ncbi:MAG: hypothetical protein ACK559_36195, partial [bacterium]
VERSAVDQFHRQPRHAGVFAGGMHRHDRRVLQARDRVDLAAEAFLGAGEEQVLSAHQLQRDGAAARSVRRAAAVPAVLVGCSARIAERTLPKLCAHLSVRGGAWPST